MNYEPERIEKKWQKIWQEAGIYNSLDKEPRKKNFYHLVMFPYPSGNLHIGHWYNFVGGDVFARLKRLQGFNVMSPMGFDAFGLPAENAAIRNKIHPKEWTEKNIERMRKQLKSIGACYDWSREIITCDPKYYKWTQWIFLQLFKKGLAYKKKASANWCPKCQSILANEQAEDGICWRCENSVEQKELEQWFLKITDYAKDLLKDLEKLDWPEKTKTMQKNWIGESKGALIKFQVLNFKFQIEVFTTRPDTLFGCTYLVLAPEHPILINLKTQITNFKDVEKYIEESKRKTEKQRISEIKEKTGIELKGLKAINPANNKEIPIFLADYVLIHYGTGAIMGVPAHDQRDLDFAQKYNLPVIEVIKPFSKNNSSLKKKLEEKGIISNGQIERAYEGEGYLVNSEKFNGIKSETAKEKIVEWLVKKNLAKKTTYYKIRDWLISRQRYWGAPIPLVFCSSCKKIVENSKSQSLKSKFNLGELLNPGWIAVSQEELPVLLPEVKDYLPGPEGKSPLAKSKNFIQTFCPKCKKPAQRETDTMDTFICSSWYYLRYADPRNEKEFASKEKLKSWLPVNIYIGGAEHTVLHLLYSRFFTKALRDLGYLNFNEPFLALRHQGVILGPDGQKMSKSRGNVIDPDEQVKKYGSDTIRMYLCFMGPYEQGGPWDPKNILGISRFLQKIWKIFEDSKNKIENSNNQLNKNLEIEKLLHKTIKKVTEDIENFRFNTAISALMILINEIQKTKLYNLDYFKKLLLLLAPFTPHLTEELWQKYVIKSSEFKIENSIHNQEWPKYNPKFIKEDKTTLVIQINGKVRDKIKINTKIKESEAKELALSQEKIKKWVKGKKIKKTIFIPGKLINFVI